MGIGALLLVGAVGNAGDDQRPSDRAAKGGEATHQTAAAAAKASKSDAERLRIKASFRLPRDSFGVFKTRSSRALVIGTIRPARSVVLHWQLRKVPGARVVDGGTVRPGGDGKFRFAVLGLTHGEHRVLVALGRITANTDPAASIPISRRIPKPRAQVASTPTPTPEPAPTATPSPRPTPEASCDPNYEGACLDPDSPDYDCEGGSGDGPDYTGTVRIVGDDPYDLDRDGDGVACDQ